MSSSSGDESEKLKDRGEDDDRRPSWRVLLTLCSVYAIEGADMALLPAALAAFQKDLGFRFSDVGWLSVAQAVATNLAGPFWGILADQGCMSKRGILAMTVLLQGLVTMALSSITAFWPVVGLRILNGVFLAALRPITNVMISETTSEGHRATMFSRLQAAMNLGMFVTTLVAVPMANRVVLGTEGWRVAFVFIGGLGAISAALVAFVLSAGPAVRSELHGFRVIVNEILSVCRFLRIPTFCVMILQGIFGTIPWTVMGNQALYYQLSGLRDNQAATLSAATPLAGGFGCLLGGFISDSLTRRIGKAGRPLTAQISVAAGIPIMYFIFWGIPAGWGQSNTFFNPAFLSYLSMTVSFGLFASWAQAGTNFPVLSEIVPAKARTRVMGWETAFENSTANLLGPPVVALLAGIFGYTFGSHATPDHGGEEVVQPPLDEQEGPPEPLMENALKDIESAQALGKAMVAVICLPWVVTFFAYGLLYWTFPRDVDRVKAGEFDETEDDDEDDSSSDDGS